VRSAALLLLLATLLSGFGVAQPAARPPVLSEIDRIVREQFWDPKLSGADWDAAVRRAAEELSKAKTAPERDAAYDRLLASLSDSHTFRMPAGRLPERGLATVGLRIGQDGDGYAVKGVIPGSSAERGELHVGDRILEVNGKPYGKDRVNFRDLFFVFEGKPNTLVEVTWQRPRYMGHSGSNRAAPTKEGDGKTGVVLAADFWPRTVRLYCTAEEPGDTLVWKSARVIERGGKKYGYIRLWGMSAETALAVVDLLLDREEASRARPELKDWAAIEGLLLDVRGNSGGYDPNILTTFLRGQWSARDYEVISRGSKRVVPPEYRKLPVALLVNSGTASAGEALTLSFRTHAIGPIVGEETAGMLSGGAAAEKLSDGSNLWLSRRAIRDLEGKSYEGKGVPPDIAVADRPGGPGEEDAVVEAGIRALSKGSGT
jgi:tricorn protease